jgi:hypothetical protein
VARVTGIVELDERVRVRIRERLGQSSAPGYMQKLLEWNGRDPGISQILTTFERYATEGRFESRPSRRPNATRRASGELWHELEMMVIDANPELLEELAGSAYASARTEMNRIVAYSLGAWCELSRRAWATGVCGSEARR